MAKLSPVCKPACERGCVLPIEAFDPFLSAENLCLEAIGALMVGSEVDQASVLIERGVRTRDRRFLDLAEPVLKRNVAGVDGIRAATLAATLPAFRGRTGGQPLASRRIVQVRNTMPRVLDDARKRVGEQQGQAARKDGQLGRLIGQAGEACVVYLGAWAASYGEGEFLYPSSTREDDLGRLSRANYKNYSARHHDCHTFDPSTKTRKLLSVKTERRIDSEPPAIKVDGRFVKPARIDLLPLAGVVRGEILGEPGAAPTVVDILDGLLAATHSSHPNHEYGIAFRAGLSAAVQGVVQQADSISATYPRSRMA